MNSGNEDEMQIDSNYERLASKLTWRDWPPGKQPHAGLLIKNEQGELFLIGDLVAKGKELWDAGCGCCAGDETPVAYADIYELVEE